MDFGFVGAGTFAQFAGEMHGEDVVFESAGAAEAPVVFSDRDSEDAFAGTLRAELGDEFAAVLVEGDAVFFGEGLELAGQIVEPGIDGASLLAFFGNGAGGFLSVFG